MRKWSSRKDVCASSSATRRITSFSNARLQEKARVIISGDKDLLSLGRYRQVRIQTPAQFLAENPELRGR